MPTGSLATQWAAVRTTEGLTSVPEQPATVPFSFRIATPAVAGVAILNENGTVAGCSGTLVSPSVVLIQDCDPGDGRESAGRHAPVDLSDRRGASRFALARLA